MNEQDNLKIYVNKKDIGKRPMLFRLITLNIIFLMICFLTSQLILIKKGVSYAASNPFLYEVVNPTSSTDKLYEFKGDVGNNYVKYNNLMWRIVKVNSSGSIMLILDEPINMLPLNMDGILNITNFLDSFASDLDESVLVSNNLCKDNITSLNNLTCDELDTNIVSLLDVYSFVNSIKEENTFITKEDEMIWLANKNEDKIWHSNGSKLSLSSGELLYEIKPVVTLKNTVKYEKGDGSRTNPYVIETTKLTIGSTVKLGEDLYQVYSMQDDIRLVSMDDSNSYTYDGDIEKIFNTLNENMDNVSYKNLLKKSSWSIININNNKIEENKIDNYFGIQNLSDNKIDNGIYDYYLASKINNYIMVYDQPIIYGSKNSTHIVKPCITIAKEDIGKFELYDGIFMVRGL